MKSIKYKFRYIPLVGVLVCCLSCSQTGLFGKPEFSDANSMVNNNTGNYDPCWFLSSDGFKSVAPEIVRKREDREMYGYPDDISLGEAIKVFNEEQSCSKYLASLPPLTEEEVMAAVGTTPDYGVSAAVWVSQKEILFKIRSKRVLPKGALLVGEANSPIVDESMEQQRTVSKGRRIYLFLALDKNPRRGELKPEQIFLIRKTFFRVENTHP